MANHTKVRVAQLWKTPLLPALKRFYCPEVRAPGLFIHFLFLSPTIQCIELKDVSDGEDEAVGTLLATISYEVPALRRLVLWGGLSGHSLSYVTQLRNLQSLELLGFGPIIDQAFMEQLGGLCYLKTLFLDLQGSPHSSFPTHGGFQALKHLTLISWFSLAEAVLTDVSSELVSFACNAPGLPAAGWNDDCTSLLSMVSQRWPTSLTSVTIVHIGQWDDVTLTVSVLLPLLGLSNLERLRVDNFVLSVVDEDIRQLAMAWPKLKSLHLPFENDDTAPKPSFAGIYTLAQYCPGLIYLHIPLSTGFIPALSEYKPKVHQLRSLLIGGHNSGVLGLSESLLIARHFDRLFPHLDDLQHLGRDITIWDKIFTMMQTFRAVRSDELDSYHNPIQH
jgi:hypothetical protein